MLAALLTPPGRGALAVVHLCGAGAKAAVEGMLGKPLSDRPRHGVLRLDGEPLDEVMARIAPGFTGEETVEITCHGGPVPVERVLRALEAGGAARVDAAGLLERGFETGHLDRIQVEAWSLLPSARTEMAARMLAAQAEGALSRAVEAMTTAGDAARLLESAPLGLALAAPPQIVIAGRPNVGKSTLFNSLLGSDRAIVSPEPGTTRDPVREFTAFHEVPVELIDTAGIEDPRDLLEQLSIERTRKTLGQAGIVLFVFDAREGPREDEMGLLRRLPRDRTLVLLNKIDAGERPPPVDALPVSAQSGKGLDGVRRKCLEIMGIRPGYSEPAPAVFTPRQGAALRQTADGRLPVPEASRLLRKSRRDFLSS